MGVFIVMSTDGRYYYRGQLSAGVPFLACNDGHFYGCIRHFVAKNEAGELTITEARGQAAPIKAYKSMSGAIKAAARINAYMAGLMDFTVVQGRDTVKLYELPVGARFTFARTENTPALRQSEVFILKTKGRGLYTVESECRAGGAFCSRHMDVILID